MLPANLAVLTYRDGFTDCVHWQGGKTYNGYARCRINGKKTLVARWLLEQSLGHRLMKHEQTRHLCIGTPGCVNPAHLISGSAKDNARDRFIQGRDPLRIARNREAKFCAHGHVLAGYNLYVRKDRPGRECKACQREAARRYREAHRA